MQQHTYSLLTQLMRLVKAAASATEGWVRVEYERTKLTGDSSVPNSQKAEENEHASAGSSGRAY